MSWTSRSLNNGTSPRVRGKRQLVVGGGRRQRYIPACAGEARGGGGSHGQSPVHPRVCGGSCCHRPLISPLAGTSPRVRGKRHELDIEVSQQRYIPACAGEATARSRRRAKAAVHPRVCGGSSSAATSTFSTTGTSPRVRGKLFRARRRPARRRYIPACAGEAVTRACGSSSRGVHPRVCGGSARRRAGSSRCIRYIPACAGEAPRRST